MSVKCPFLSRAMFHYRNVFLNKTLHAILLHKYLMQNDIFVSSTNSEMECRRNNGRPAKHSYRCWVPEFIQSIYDCSRFQSHLT